MLLLSSADIFQKFIFFQKLLSGTLSECQMVWIQIRTNNANNKERAKFSTKIPSNFNSLTKLSKHGLKHISISNTPVHISLYVFVFLARLYLRHLTLKALRKKSL